MTNRALTHPHARRHRVHYRPAPGDAPICGTTTKRPMVTGDEIQVSCRRCRDCLEKRHREGRVDLFGSAA